MKKRNHVELEGKLIRDPELRYTTRRVAIVEFRMAFSSPKSNPAQEKVAAALASASTATRMNSKASSPHIDVIVMGDTAELCAEYLRSGRAVVVTGKLAHEHWELHGFMGSRIRILASAVKMPEAPPLSTAHADSAFVRDAVRPALKRFGSRLKSMNAAEAASFLADAVDPFIHLYNRHRKSFGGPPSTLWPPEA